MKSLIANLRIFWQGTLLSYIALFHWLNPPTYLASKILMPLAQILFFTFLGVYATGLDNASFYVIGNAVQIAAVSGIYGVTMSIGGDRYNGTLPYLFRHTCQPSGFVPRSLVRAHHRRDARRGDRSDLGRAPARGRPLKHRPCCPRPHHPDHHLQHLRPGAA